MEKGSLRELCEEVKRRLDYRSFFMRYCRSDARITSDKLHTRCPIPTHAHSGQGGHSLSIDLRRGLFHCFAREEGGDAIRFYELMHNASFPRAVRELARELGLSPDGTSQAGHSLRHAPEPSELLEERAVEEPLPGARLAAVCESFLEVCKGEEQMEGINYLSRRGISARAMKRAGVVYFPRRAYRRVMKGMLDKFELQELQQSGLFNTQAHLTFYKHRLLFPFYAEGRAVYLQARTTASGVEPRWHNMRGPVPSLYNADALHHLLSGEIVYLVEGFTDTLTLLTHGFTAVGLVGAGGLKEEWLAPLARFRVVAALDGDRAGESATARYQELFAARRLRLAQVRLATDVNDFFRHHPSAPLEFSLLTEAALEKQKSEDRSQESEDSTPLTRIF
ncbi:MAG: toprim domain-containing protein [Acidobacteria bacterium]|nr:toprim domain-containing protein [Acidobacteriota bacterium]